MAGRAKLAFALVLATVLAASVGACGGGSAATSGSTGATPSSGGSSAQGQGNRGASEGKEGSAGFVVPGGDNSVQRFGSEAPASVREAASGVVEAYMRARSARDWSAECAALARSTIEPLEALAANSAKLKGATCATLLSALAGARSAPVNTMTGPIGSLRVEGDRGFALFHGTQSIDYVVPMRREGGVWKVGTLEPVELG